MEWGSSRGAWCVPQNIVVAVGLPGMQISRTSPNTDRARSLADPIRPKLWFCHLFQGGEAGTKTGTKIATSTRNPDDYWEVRILVPQLLKRLTAWWASSVSCPNATRPAAGCFYLCPRTGGAQGKMEAFRYFGSKRRAGQTISIPLLLLGTDHDKYDFEHPRRHRRGPGL